MNNILIPNSPPQKDVWVMTKTDFQKDIIAELHKSENTNSSNLDAEISFLIIFGQTEQIKNA